MRLFAVLFATAVAFASLPAPARADVPVRTVAPSETFESGMLRVERFGVPGKPAVILIPGLFCGSWEWNGQIPALAAKYDVYAVTLPGLDGRPRDERGDLMNRVAIDLNRLIAARHLAPATIVGHSLGGTIAVFFGEKYPNVVRSVITVEGGYPEAPTQAERVKAADNEAKPYDSANAKTVGSIVRTTTLQYTITKKSDVDMVTKLAARSDAKAVADWLRAALVLDLTPGLNNITAPFVAIVPFDPQIDPYVGDKTLEAKRVKYTEWVAHAKNGRVVMINHSRHFVMFDQPAEFNRALLMATNGTR